ncbi:single-stranded DNA-binding protein [Nocardioides alkalitolerans]|uniref:single-stranded DNA-binding protein n=1 Tax=Nocardioides alkalitolerans TaxID=281714 RepID=UPI000424CC46|nr:single-stranded DNA-binding protein [Nocardioides alkalitolerans]
MSITVITFAGNAVADPELRYTPQGKAVANLRVLVNRRVRISAGERAGEWEDAEPTAHNVTVWGQPAENVAETIRRGDRVVVHGHVETETWADRESGEKRTRDVVVVNERDGEIGASLSYASAKLEKNPRRTSTDTNGTDDGSGADR